MIESSKACANAPSAKPDRIETLDVLRGLAILGIFFLNIPLMSPAGWSDEDGREMVSWMDRFVSAVDGLLLEGTQRGMLEMLFGAGMILLTAKAMRADGPVGVADGYFRRNLWLLAFGLLHVFLVQWPYDILHVYAVAALFLFPFRLLSPAAALCLGLSFALFSLVGGAVGGGYGPESMLADGAMTEAAGPTGAISLWLADAKGLGLWTSIGEALCTMLIGVALFKWGVIQGRKSVNFYFSLAAAAYGAGLALRASEMSGAAFAGVLDVSELSRLAVTVGHIALVNLAWRSGIGRWVLGPFTAAGRTAFSLYVMQSLIGIWVLFAPWSPLHDEALGSAHLAALAILVMAVQLVIANLWLRRFQSGPLEWLWRWLTNRWPGGEGKLAAHPA